MEFALFSHVPWPEGTDPKQVYDDITEEFVLGEELGFKSAWMAEHHFTRYGLGSAPNVLASSIVAKTTTLRIGSAIFVSPLHLPARLAEEIATLDVLSGGRIDVGFGRGAASSEYKVADVPIEESQQRFQESITMIEGLWTNRNYTFEGKHYKITNANLVPQPVQSPHPPIYIAATRTPATQDFVAGSGHPLLIGVVLDTADAVALCHTMVDLSKTKGQDMKMGQIPFFRYFYVAETEEQARADAKPSLDWNLDMIQWRRTFDTGSEVWEKMEDFRNSRTELPPSFDYLTENRAFIGSPDQVIAKIKALQDEGIELFGCNFSFGGMPQDKVLKSMRLFAKEVMPAFK
jgi:alkanesulfonate monooxygenase SsuD/methylene tetrahydromethanopterin reductase-like flavin-dependent oxidoreductase (luciferase family)|tara:strand:+ start:628 stop:1668 length:1041 start_codon:yes stop_codon:yes gene_type:complete